MKLQRRRFLQAAGLAGLSVLTPMPYGSDAQAQAGGFVPYEGPYYIMINLIGGWDTTRFLDPKGTERSIGPNGPINWDYSDNDIINVGTAQKPLRVMPAPYYGTFFDNYRDRVTFVNGVEHGTNGHNQGERVCWSGTLQRGWPTMAALVAAERSAGIEIPVPFLTFGGYDKTGDLIVPTRLQNMAAFTKIVAPSVARFDGEVPTPFFDGFAEDAINAAAEARLEAARINATLPRTAKGMDALYTGRVTEGSIGQVMNYFDPLEFDAFGTNRLGQLRKQAYLSLSTFEAGVAVSANLAFTGWDHHSNILTGFEARMTELFALLTDIRGWAEDRGIGDQVHIFVGSDFSRTPFENATAGKDHWAVGSMMHISANPNGGRGTIGATDDLMRGMNLDAGLNVVARDAENSERITPAVLNNDIRRLAGVADSPFAEAYPLDGDPPADIFT